VLHSRRRHNPDSAPMSTTTKVVIVAGGILGVGAIVLLARKAAAAAIPSNPGVVSLPMITSSDDGSLTQPAPPPGGIGFGVNTSGSGGGSSGSDMSNITRLTALYARLHSDQNALQIYAFQALNYELGFTNATPDGLMGPQTQGMIQSIQQRNNLPVTGTFDPSLIAAIANVANYSFGTSVRSLPDTLPSDILASLNSFINSQVATAGSTIPYVTANILPVAPTSSG
jgi:hypothetical protein